MATELFMKGAAVSRRYDCSIYNMKCSYVETKLM